ncbi:MAG: DUF72 domain-containing protein [Actinomycetota bacterium]|nr:DUF72 domain-containing protein [Actinomycetota bacterium]
MGTVLIGASSCSARSLVHDSHWYPRRSMKAAQRIAYYAERFPIVELDATYRFPPTPDLARQWVERTPGDFLIDVQAWTLLTGNATLPDSLWPDLRLEVRPELRDRRRLYLGHLSEDGRTEAWRRFGHALLPLADAGRLGAVVLRYPHWLRPGDTGRALLAEARRRLADFRLAVELRNHHWLDQSHCEQTLAFLEDHDLAFVCVDSARSAHAPPVVATTTDLAVVRLEGRNPGEWDEADLSLGERFAYLYPPEELAAWGTTLGQLAEAADQVHVLFANAYRDFAVRNAAQLADLVKSSGRCQL